MTCDATFNRLTGPVLRFPAASLSHAPARAARPAGTLLDRHSGPAASRRCQRWRCMDAAAPLYLASLAFGRQSLIVEVLARSSACPASPRSTATETAWIATLTGPNSVP